MENKLINNTKDYDITYHPTIKGLQIVEGKNNFPISWLNIQGYCEYSLYLQYFKGIEVGQTKAMKRGTEVHQSLEDKFRETATPTTFREALNDSKKEELLSREMFVISPKYGIRGFIDEVRLTPDEFIIIDDKPGTTPYSSTINQVRAYCLAFKDMLKSSQKQLTFDNLDIDNRKIIGALRERGTDNVFYSEEFDSDTEDKIKYVINRMDGLFKGEKPFIPTKNPKKCNSCRFKGKCGEAAC